MPQATVQDGIEIEYEVVGEGEPLLFVMGLGGQLVDWPDEFVELFVEAGFQVIRFDNRDVGLSTQTSWKPPSHRRAIWAFIRRKPLKDVGYTVNDMADDAAGLLAHLRLDSAHVVGMSMGGMIAQALTIRHPLRVRSLCSVMSNTGDRKNGGFSWPLVRQFGNRPTPTRETAVDGAAEMFEAISGPWFDSDVYRINAEESVKRSFTPVGTARQTAAISASPDRTAQLGQVSCPTLVVHGMVDPLVQPSGGTATAAAVPGSRLLMFPDMGHDLPEPRWEEMRDAIVANTRRA
ncbi:MAG: alpha/beta fold hydrolase [Acidimicrobiales bacterium]|jgi:pimeloyl-ACP methyl ester carboxylesterase